MALTIIVEDGTVVPNANSYIDGDDMKAFWDNWGHSYTTLTDAQVDLLLYSAAETLDAKYYDAWPGYRSDDEQTMEWPRDFARYQDGEEIESTEIPIEVKKAQAKLCYLLNSGEDLQPKIGLGGTVRSLREKVDVIEVETVYDNSSSLLAPIYMSLNYLLIRIIGHRGRFGKLKVYRE